MLIQIKSVDRAYSKYGAVALANAHIKKLSIKQIKRCDEIIEKTSTIVIFMLIV